MLRDALSKQPGGLFVAKAGSGYARDLNNATFENLLAVSVAEQANLEERVNFA